MLTFIGSHPVAAYIILMMFVVALVYYKAYKKAQVESTDVPPLSPPGVVVDISGAGSRAVGKVGDVGDDLRLGDEVHHHYPKS